MDNIEEGNDTNDDTLNIYKIVSELPKLVEYWLYHWYDWGDKVYGNVQIIGGDEGSKFLCSL